MNSTAGPSDPKRDATQIGVTCELCGTRIHVSSRHIGKMVKCPDCDSKNLIRAPQPKSKSKRAEPSGDEYKLRDDGDAPIRQHQSSAKRPSQLITMTCGLCDTLMRARPEHIGKRIRCPECKSLTTVTAPLKKAEFKAPDVSDVQLDAAPTPTADGKKKEIADRLMAEAEDHVERKRASKPIPPKAPLRETIYSFPFYLKVFPFWLGLAACILLNWALLDVIIDMIAGGGYASIMVAFLVPMLSLGVMGTVGLVAPHFLSIIEFTSEGHNDIPYWPSQDLLTRMRASFFGINSLALATAPCVLGISFLQKAGVGIPMICAIIPIVVLLPWILLSMLDNESVFLPYSSLVFGNVRRMASEWFLFFVHVLLGAIVIVAIDQIVYRFAPQASRYITVGLLCIFAVIFCRLVGRMAWILGERTATYRESDES